MARPRALEPSSRVLPGPPVPRPKWSRPRRCLVRKSNQQGFGGGLSRLDSRRAVTLVNDGLASSCRDVDGPPPDCEVLKKPPVWNRPDPCSRCLAGRRQRSAACSVNISKYPPPPFGRLITTDIRHSFFLTCLRPIDHHDHQACWTWASARSALFFLCRPYHYNRGPTSVLSNLHPESIWLG